MTSRLLIIGLIGLLAALAGCTTSQSTTLPASTVPPQNTAVPTGPVTLRYEEGAQVEITSPGGIRVLIDVADPSALSRPATDKDILLTTHTHEDHFNHAFVKAFTGQQLMTRQGKIAVGDVVIQGIASAHNARDQLLAENGTNYIYLVDTGGLRIGHFGDIGQEALTQEQLATIGHVDIAITQFANLYSNMSLQNHKGFNLMDQVRPTLIIPTHFDMATAKYAVEHWSGAFTPEKAIAFSSKILPDKTCVLFMGETAPAFGKILHLPQQKTASLQK